MKTLIYFTFGHNLDYINLAKLCVESLYRVGYDGDLLFISDMKEEILSTIQFNKPPFFLEVSKTDLMSSSANKLKIYQFSNVKDYDKIILSDVDILWLKSPSLLFDIMTEDKFYVTTEPGSLISHNWWGENLLTPDEKIYIQAANIRGINAGIFGFTKKMIPHFEYIERHMRNNMHLANDCLEQPFFNVYLFRNRLYEVLQPDLISHLGYNLSSFDGMALHFAGVPGFYSRKIEKMQNYIKTNKLFTTFKNRNELIASLGHKQRVCEIGVFKGDFSEILHQKLSPSELHLIDLFDGITCSGDKDGNDIVYTDMSLEYQFLINKYIDDDSVYLHKGKSQEALARFDDEYFDLIYIDGDHSFQGVKQDLEISMRKTKTNGLICGHDYSKEKFPEVVSAVDEFCRDYNLEISGITNDGCPSFIIKKKFTLEKFNEIVSPYTMTSFERISSLFNSLENIRKNNIPGDFVECGVWKGGNILGMISYMNFYNMSGRQVWLYDTFQGMTEPEDLDVDLYNNRAQNIYQSPEILCLSPLEEVKANLNNIYFDRERIKVNFVVGDVSLTLQDSQNVPENISILRLDTDWYKSTKDELFYLYPKLNKGGVLIVDDYGHWQGAKKAVDEYFLGQSIEIKKIDYTGIEIIK